MSTHWHDLAQFFGHFHPALVHLPVGGLVLLCVLELLAAFPRFRDLAQNRRTILGIVTIGAVAAACCGWLLSLNGSYDAELLYRHRLIGIGVAGACILTLLACGFAETRVYRVALAITLVLLVLAGHWGGQMTHGRGFLTRYAPSPLRTLFGRSAGFSANHAAASGPTSVYAKAVEPILQKRCVSCHGPDKQKGDLRLDSIEAMRRGGQSGPALLAGKAAESLMIRRLLLPLDDEDHMPPDGKPQPTQAEIGMLQWWINTGEAEQASAASLKPSPEVLQMLEAAGLRQTR